MQKSSNDVKFVQLLRGGDTTWVIIILIDDLLQDFTK